MPIRRIISLEETGYPRVAVMDSVSKAPIHGAKVTLEGQVRYTNAYSGVDGSTAPFDNISIGNHLLTVDKEGYKHYENTFNLPYGQDLLWKVYLTVIPPTPPPALPSKSRLLLIAVPIIAVFGYIIYRSVR